jgi:hypothetical protein
MGFENVAFLCTHFLDDLALNFQNLTPGLREGSFETGDFGRNKVRGNIPARDDPPCAMQHEDFPPADTGGNANASKHTFPFRMS